MDRPDPALDALMLALAGGTPGWPAAGRTLFLGARTGVALQAARGRALDAVQPFKPWADALAADGVRVLEAPQGRYGRVLLLAPRQREAARALLAVAFDQLAPGGVVVASAPNNAGGRALQDDLAALAGPVAVVSKYHCRTVWTAALAGPADAALHAAWRELGTPRPVAGGRLLSVPGVFAWDRVDPATALLADALPPDLAGAAADLGAGVGVLSLALLARCPGITTLDLFEADARALGCARANLAGARVPVASHWHDVTAGLPGRYDVVVTNPPFHLGRADEPALGRAFIAAAAAALRPGGRLWLVANRHLPYESALAAGFARVRTAAEDGGFKVFEAVKA